MLMMGVIFIGMVFGDAPDETASARQELAGHLLWITPLAGLVIFAAVRWIVDSIRAGRR